MNNDKLVIVTGLSGSGLSSVLKTLEDLGFEAFDNLPLSLLPDLLNQNKSAGRSIALGIDTRSRDFNIADLLKQNAKLVFLTCDDNILLKRFTETRRRHPLAIDRPIHTGIKEERELLEPLKDNANIVIDDNYFIVSDARQISTHNSRWIQSTGSRSQVEFDQR